LSENAGRREFATGGCEVVLAFPMPLPLLQVESGGQVGAFGADVLLQ
jgi:hypothetical protein